jgi:Protein of unknown function (DUF4239)
MSDWLHNLPVPWLTVVVFGATCLGVGFILLVVMALATGKRARWFKGFSPGMLSPLGILFGLLIAFVASQVWSDFDRANNAVYHEASALRTVMLLTGAFPAEHGGHLQALVRRHIQETVTQEWPAMASHQASLKMTSGPLAEALHGTLELTPHGDRQALAQRELVIALQNALDARRQRIILSGSAVNWIKWTGLLLVAATTLVAIAFVHCDNWKTAALAMGVFATAVAIVVILIISHDSPFTGPIAVRPAVLLQVLEAH